jgi:hypothetical protein
VNAWAASSRRAVAVSDTPLISASYRDG